MDDSKVSNRSVCPGMENRNGQHLDRYVLAESQLGARTSREIDDEQLFFFYNLLILYHIKTGELLQTVNQNERR